MHLCTMEKSSFNVTVLFMVGHRERWVETRTKFFVVSQISAILIVFPSFVPTSRRKRGRDRTKWTSVLLGQVHVVLSEGQKILGKNTLLGKFRSKINRDDRANKEFVFRFLHWADRQMCSFPEHVNERSFFMVKSTSQTSHSDI